MPDISVLMPVWNAVDTVMRAIDSILQQTHADFELIVVDDGSTDGTSELLQNAASRDARILYYRQGHSGITTALNTGLGLATGRYIARMDADDYAVPERLAEQKRLLDAQADLGLVSCLVSHSSMREHETNGYSLYVDWINGLCSAEDIALNRFIESPLAHPSVMFSKELVERFGGYREGPFPEDYDLWLRWMEAGVKMAKVSKTLLEWSDPPGRLSRVHSNYSIDAFYDLKAQYLARWLEKNNPRHPEVIIWGAGRASRKRAIALEAQGCRIVGYIDVDPKRRGTVINGRPVWLFDELQGPEQGFIVSYAGKRGARLLIRTVLESQGCVEGVHFVLAA